MPENVKVEVTCHENFLVINTIDPTHDENFVPAGNGRIGCVLMDAEKHLGMSDEAFKLLKTMKVGTDAIGDVATFESNKGQCFSWLGHPQRLVDMSDEEICSSREGIIDLKYVPIENKVPVEAFEAITKWNEPDEEDD